jgi:hydrogenase 3 maturation protease
MGADRQLSEFLETLCGSNVLILGVGNVLKADDAAGPLVCERLSGKISAKVIDAGKAPENHIRPILKAAPNTLLIVDAVDFGGQPGQMRLLGPEQIRKSGLSTHALSLHLFIDVLRREGDMDVHLIGIQAGHTRLGDPLSPAVERAIAMLVDTFCKQFTLPDSHE